MKKFIAVLLLLSVSLSMVFVTGCSGDEDSSSSSSSDDTQSYSYSDSTDMLKDYLASFVEGDNPFYGTWQIEDFDYLSFVFRNDGYAELAMGTEGDFTTLTIDEDEKTVSLEFIVGLNGVYDYEFSNDEQTLTLTLDGEETVLNKQDDFNFVPDPPEVAEVDEDIIGWWQSEDGLIYYFGEDGIMYSNLISSETCYTYCVADGKIEAIYTYGDEIEYEVEYSYKKGVLTIDGNEYESYDPFE